MDYKLPDGSGLDVAERIRSKWGGAPIIMISGYDPSTIALRAEKLHISNFLEKPFSREIICAAVKNAIGSQAAIAASAPAKDGAKVPPDGEIVPKRLLGIKGLWRGLRKS